MPIHAQAKDKTKLCEFDIISFKIKYATRRQTKDQLKWDAEWNWLPSDNFEFWPHQHFSPTSLSKVSTVFSNFSSGFRSKSCIFSISSALRQNDPRAPKTRAKYVLLCHFLMKNWPTNVYFAIARPAHLGDFQMYFVLTSLLTSFWNSSQELLTLLYFDFLPKNLVISNFTSAPPSISGKHLELDKIGFKIKYAKWKQTRYQKITYKIKHAVPQDKAAQHARSIRIFWAHSRDQKVFSKQIHAKASRTSQSQDQIILSTHIHAILVRSNAYSSRNKPKKK